MDRQHCVQFAAVLAMAALPFSLARAVEVPSSSSAPAAQTDSDDEGSSHHALGIHIGPFRLLPTLGLSFGYDSNVALQAGDETSADFYRISPAIRLETGGERNLLSATYTGEFGRYNGTAIDNYNDQNLRLDWFYNPVLRQALSLDASTRFSHDRRGTAAREGDLGNLGLDVDRYRRNELGGKYRFGAPTARARIEVEARLGSRDYLNNRIYTRFRDFDDSLIGAGIAWRFAPKTSAVLKIDQTTYDYRVATLDNRERHAYLGVEWDATARTTGTLLIGRVQKNFDDPTRDDFSGASWRAGVQWKPRTYSTVDFTAGRETDETNGTGDFILRRDYTLGWGHDWSERFRTTLDGGWANEEHKPTTRSDDTTFFGVSAAYRLFPALRVGASYRNYNRDSNSSQFTYVDDTWLLSVEGSL